jgi:carboxyl-terminal processing protease
MKKKVSLGYMISLIIVAAVVTFTITWQSATAKMDQRINSIMQLDNAIEKVTKIDEIARAYYINEIDRVDIADGLAHGYVFGLGDKYGAYFDQSSYKQMMAEQKGNNIGIGVNVIRDEQTGRVKVISVVKDSPADKNGVMAGDMVIKVGEESADDLGYELTVIKLLGDVGTTADFTVLRGTESIVFSIVRDIFTVQTIEQRMVGEDIGYIRIASFNDNTPGEFSDAVEALCAQGCNCFLFDVRHNPGGELNSISSILDAVLPEGPIINIVSKGGEMETISSGPEELLYPIAVLIDENTYSAAELFAAAIKDYQKGILVGMNTYGKGTMQSVIPLGDGSGISLSTAMYNPPYGENYEGIGVKPDVEIPLPENLEVSFYEMTDVEDTQLQAAISELKKNMGE